MRALRLVGLLLTAVAALGSATIRPAEASATPPAFGPGELCVTGIAHGDVLNLRFGPGTDHGVVRPLAPGRCGLIQTGPARGAWVPLAVHEAGPVVHGWAHGAYLAPPLPPPPPPPPLLLPVPPPVPVTGQLCVTATTHLNLRTGPSTADPVIAQLNSNECRLFALGPAHGPWRLVRWEASTTWIEGWVHQAWVIDVPPPSTSGPAQAPITASSPVSPRARASKSSDPEPVCIKAGARSAGPAPGGRSTVGCSTATWRPAGHRKHACPPQANLRRARAVAWHPPRSCGEPGQERIGFLYVSR